MENKQQKTNVKLAWVLGISVIAWYALAVLVVLR